MSFEHPLRLRGEDAYSFNIKRVARAILCSIESRTLRVASICSLAMSISFLNSLSLFSSFIAVRIAKANSSILPNESSMTMHSWLSLFMETLRFNSLRFKSYLLAILRKATHESGFFKSFCENIPLSLPAYFEYSQCMNRLFSVAEQKINQRFFKSLPQLCKFSSSACISFLKKEGTILLTVFRYSNCVCFLIRVN